MEHHSIAIEVIQGQISEALFNNLKEASVRNISDLLKLHIFDLLENKSLPKPQIREIYDLQIWILKNPTQLEQLLIQPLAHRFGRKGFQEVLLAIPIEQIKDRVVGRLYNVFARQGFQTIGDILLRSRADFENYPRVGSGVLHLLDDFVEQLYFNPEYYQTALKPLESLGRRGRPSKSNGGPNPRIVAEFAGECLKAAHAKVSVDQLYSDISQMLKEAEHPPLKDVKAMLTILRDYRGEMVLDRRNRSFYWVGYSEGFKKTAAARQQSASVPDIDYTPALPIAMAILQDAPGKVYVDDMVTRLNHSLEKHKIDLVLNDKAVLRLLRDQYEVVLDRRNRSLYLASKFARPQRENSGTGRRGRLPKPKQDFSYAIPMVYDILHASAEKVPVGVLTDEVNKKIAAVGDLPPIDEKELVITLRGQQKLVLDRRNRAFYLAGIHIQKQPSSSGIGKRGRTAKPKVDQALIKRAVFDLMENSKNDKWPVWELNRMMNEVLRTMGQSMVVGEKEMMLALRGEESLVLDRRNRAYYLASRSQVKVPKGTGKRGRLPKEKKDFSAAKDIALELIRISPDKKPVGELVEEVNAQLQQAGHDYTISDKELLLELRGYKSLVLDRRNRAFYFSDGKPLKKVSTGEGKKGRPKKTHPVDQVVQFVIETVREEKNVTVERLTQMVNDWCANEDLDMTFTEQHLAEELRGIPVLFHDKGNKAFYYLKQNENMPIQKVPRSSTGGFEAPGLFDNIQENAAKKYKKPPTATATKVVKSEKDEKIVEAIFGVLGHDNDKTVVMGKLVEQIQDATKLPLPVIRKFIEKNATLFNMLRKNKKLAFLTLSRAKLEALLTTS